MYLFSIYIINIFLVCESVSLMNQGDRFHQNEAPRSSQDHEEICDVIIKIPACFYTRDALCVWTNLGKQLLFVWLNVFSIVSIKTGTRCIMHLDKLCSFRHTTDGSSCRCIMHLVLSLYMTT